MKVAILTACLAAIFCGCAAPAPPQSTRLPAGIVAGRIRTISFSGLTGSKPFIVVGEAYMTIAEPEVLKGKELLIWSSDDYPFRIGDEVEFDLTGVGIDQNPDGALSTTMFYRFPIKIRSNPSSTAHRP